ncbi:MAG: L-seryl-tRNA(Sec) selenium transferase [Firmicutes bacterium]|nr:L-seryl-tRNA(Sec) selenium transferase [Bacillota bacterium]
MDRYLQNLPAVDRTMQRARQALGGDCNPALLSEACREAVEGLRQALLQGREQSRDRQALLSLAAAEAQRIYKKKMTPPLRRVLNATGVPLHTNMGRAPLARAALDAIETCASGYCDLELDLEQGKRGLRGQGIVELLCELSGAEAACLVNNNAAAVLLALHALAGGGEVILSRGQMVEIGGSFRLPDIIGQSGAVLREVGCTNKTYTEDYRRAVGERTALLLWVHQSNFQQVGFVQSVDLPALQALGRETGLPVLADLGSGCLYPAAPWLAEQEPLLRQMAKTADVITCSGDKLLGGPQTGVILGKKACLRKIQEDPLYRVLRPDKLALAALGATLLLYRQERWQDIPLLAMLAADLPQLRQKCAALRQMLADCPGLNVEEEQIESEVGGGSLPQVRLSGWALLLRHDRFSAEALARALRKGEPPAIAYIRKDKLIVDPRTLSDRDMEDLAASLGRICRAGE